MAIYEPTLGDIVCTAGHSALFQVVESGRRSRSATLRNIWAQQADFAVPWSLLVPIHNIVRVHFSFEDDVAHRPPQSFIFEPEVPQVSCLVAVNDCSGVSQVRRVTEKRDTLGRVLLIECTAPRIVSFE